MAAPDVNIRGIRGPMPSGYILGRQSAGSGPPELLSISELAGPLQNQVTSVFGRKGAIVATVGDYSVAQVTGAAPLASPTFTGAPAAPTPTLGDNSTKLATTAFVQSAIGATTGSWTPTFSGLTAVGAEAHTGSWVSIGGKILFYQIVIAAATSVATTLSTYVDNAPWTGAVGYDPCVMCSDDQTKTAIGLGGGNAHIVFMGAMAATPKIHVSGVVFL